MADLLHNKLLHSLSLNPSRSPSFPFPLSLSPQPNFCVIRFASSRRTRLSHSSTVLVNLSPDSGKLDIVSTSEQEDGSVVFKFGNASQISQNVSSSDGAPSEGVIGVLDDEYGVNHVKSEILGTSDGVSVVNFDEESVTGEEQSEFAANDGIEVVISINSKGEDDHCIEVEGSTSSKFDDNGGTEVAENHSIEVEDSAESKVDGDDVNEVESLTESRMEHQETVLESVGYSVEDEQNHDLVSTVEMENSNGSGMVNHDVESNNVPTMSDSTGDLVIENSSDFDLVKHDLENSNVPTTSNSTGDLVIENSSDSELVKYGVRVETVVATSDSSENLIMGTLKGTSDGEVAAAVSTSQLELNGRELLGISEKSSCVQSSELATSLEDIEVGSSVASFADEEGDNDVAENDVTNSLIEASDKMVSSEDKEFLSDAKNLFDEETDNNDMVKSAKTNSHIEASDMIASVEDEELISYEKHVANEEDGDNVMLETAKTDSSTEATDIEVSLNDDERHISKEQLANEKYGDSDMLETADTNLPAEASDIAVSLDDDEHENGVKKLVADKKDNDNAMLETLKATSPVETSDVAVSLEDDEHDSDMGLETTDTKEVIEQVSVTAVSSEDDEHDSNGGLLVNKEHADNDMPKMAETNSAIKVSDNAVSLADYERDRNVKPVVNEEDDDKKLQEVATINSLETSDIALSLEDDELDSNMTRTIEEDGDGKLQKIEDVNSVVEASDVARSLQDSELDSNGKRILNEDDGLVELMEKLAPSEAEPILDEESSFDSQDNVVAMESTFRLDMVDEAAPPIIPQSDNDLFQGDSLKAASPEASGIPPAEAIIDRIDSTECAAPAPYLSSAAASLPHPGEALTGGEDVYFVCPNWFGVADGVGQWSFGGTDRGRYAHELMRICEKLALCSQGTELTDMKEALQQIAVSTLSSGSARVLIAHFVNQTLHVANVGDTGFAVIRNGVTFKKSTPGVHEFNFPYAIGPGIDPLESVEEYHIQLEDGDVIVAATDGLFDNLYGQEIASIVSKSMGAGVEPKEVAEVLVTKAQEVGSLAYGRSPFADAAQAAGHTGVVGGKLDHVTVIVSLVQKG